MKKKIFLTLLFLIILGTTCYAEQWELIEEKGNDLIYLDTTSLQQINWNGFTVVKGIVKIQYKNKEYGTYNIWINKDYKEFKTVRMEKYSEQGVLISSWDSSPFNQYWTKMPYEYWDKTLNEMIKRAII